MSATPNALSTIVLVAHGPASETLTAARRLEPMVERASNIIVVEGTAPGATAVTRASTRGYSIADDADVHHRNATRTLAAVVRQATGPVLVVHDDVIIDSSSVTALLEEHQRTGLVTAPDDGSRHDHVDLFCAVGSPAQLGALAERAGFGPGMVLEETIARATTATAVHRQACQKRMIKPGELGRPLLVAALIVRDEEERLADCLASLDGVVDRIEVVDTGSIDATVEIARDAGALVTEIDWRNDFAWARNQALDRCTDAAYMLWVDADERFHCDNPTKFRSMLATYSCVYPSFSVQLHNLKADGSETHSFTARRIVDPSVIQFRGALHEQAVRVDNTPLVTAHLSNASIRHLGYDADVVDIQRKMNRNLDVARTGFDDDPSEANAVSLARAIKGALTDPEDAIVQIAPIQASLADAPAPVQAILHGLSAELYLAAERLDDAITASRATLDLVPADAVAGAVLAESLSRTNRPREVVVTAADYAARPSPTPLIIDHLAEQTRARIVFEAAIRIGEGSIAATYVGQLPPELDPWPALAEQLELDELVDLAAAAAVTDDTRYLRMLTSQTAITALHVERVAVEFINSNHDGTRALLDGVREELDLREAHVELRRVFERTESADDAIAYTRCLTVGHIDLSIELDDVDTHHEPIALSLALAAEAHERRGDATGAYRDADAAIQRWPGSTRAATIVADCALVAGDPGRALDVLRAARTAKPTDRITRNRRHAMAGIAARAQLDLGDLTAAVSEAAEIVDDDGSFAHWDRLLVAADGDLQSMALVLGLAMLSDGVEFIDALAHAVLPARTAEICGTYLALGGQNPDAVSTGVLAAIMSSQDELALVIADHGTLLPLDVRTRLASHLRSSGSRDVALRLMVDQTERQAA